MLSCQLYFDCDLLIPSYSQNSVFHWRQLLKTDRLLSNRKEGCRLDGKLRIQLAWEKSGRSKHRNWEEEFGSLEMTLQIIKRETVRNEIEIEKCLSYSLSLYVYHSIFFSNWKECHMTLNSTRSNHYLQTLGVHKRVVICKLISEYFQNEINQYKILLQDVDDYGSPQLLTLCISNESL